MEKELNIVEILKDKEKGTKLFDKLRCIYVCLDNVELVSGHITCTGDKVRFSYTSCGGYSDDYPNGLQILKPSHLMQDWSKFAWKKGDVLKCGIDRFCIFDEWVDYTYTEFKAMYVTFAYDNSVCYTGSWTKEANENTIKQYISKIEEVKGGKLNLTTLEIDKTEQKFKVGDIVYLECVPYGNMQSMIFIYKGETSDEYYHYVAVCPQLNNKLLKDGIALIDKQKVISVRFATNEEQSMLFKALKSKDLYWSKWHKKVYNYPIKGRFQTFDKVLVRDESPYNDMWFPAIFLFDNDGSCNTGAYQVFCLHTGQVKNFSHCEPYEGNEMYAYTMNDITSSKEL